MREYRQDATTGAWVIVAPENGAHRRRSRLAAVAAPAAGRHADCPFCPGNERLLPPIIEQTSAAETPGWQVRVVPDRLPILAPLGDPGPVSAGYQMRLAGFGYHEVVIESPRHDHDLARFSDIELSTLVRAWQARFAELSARPGIEAVFVFRNHLGGVAGGHPHSQVVATAIVPPWAAVRAAWSRDRLAESGHCPTCEELAHEALDGRRVVERSRHFLVTVPFAARSPYELRITPFRHRASFADAGPAELDELGPILRRTLGRLRAALDDPDYALVIASPAPHGHDPAGSHWCVCVVPDPGPPGGFELGSGLPVNPSLPETDAAALRAAVPAPRRP